MIVIDKVYILDIKFYKSDYENKDYLEFLPNKSMYNGLDKKQKFATFRYGGIINNFVVTANVKVYYTTLEKGVEHKLNEFASDLVDDNLLNQIRRAVDCIRLPIFD